MAAIGLLELDLMLPEARTLKEKRAVLNSIRDKVRHSLNVSIAEVAYQDKPGRSHLAVVSIAAERETVEKRFKSIQDITDLIPGAIVLTSQKQWL